MMQYVKQHGLNVIEKPEGKAMNYVESGMQKKRTALF